MKRLLSLFWAFLFLFPSLSPAKELPKIAVWDLAALGIPTEYAKQLTEILASEVVKIKKYEVYSQENVRTLAGWEAQKMQLGCTDARCLTALGQMDIARLVSGSAGKIGNRYTVSLSLFDTQNVRAENKLTEFCRSEDELIELVQATVRKLLGEEPVSPPPPAQAKIVAQPLSTPSSSKARETARDGRFIAYNDGTVLDTRTNLMWAAKDNGSFINWADAKSYCKNFRGGGYTNWRMPTLDELSGLYDQSKSYRPAQADISVHLTELIELTDFCVWAADVRGSDVAVFPFNIGGQLWGPPSGPFRALPVRSGK
jgi:hypothetical protein